MLLKFLFIYILLIFGFCENKDTLYLILKSWETEKNVTNDSTAKQRNDPFFSFEGIISSKIFHVKIKFYFFPDIKQSYKKANLLSLLEFDATYLDEKWTIDLYWSFVQGSQIIIYLSMYYK